MTRSPMVAPIVEGDGEVKAVPELIRRIGIELLGNTWIEVIKPFKLDSGKMRKPDELAKAIRFQGARITGSGGVLVLRDGDDKDVTCPVTLASSLKAGQEAMPIAIEVVIAWREYEAWLLAALDSIRDHKAIRDDASFLDDPEGSRGPKGRLESLMLESYKETRHQVKFSALIDLEMAKTNSRSFRRMVHAIEILAGR